MSPNLKAKALPVLIGSLPLDDHRQAHRLVMSVTPEIPLWVQLPGNPNERMIPQFMPGLPGIKTSPERDYVDTGDDRYEQQLLEFYEEYMAVTAGEVSLADSRFKMDPEIAGGFFTLIEALEQAGTAPTAIKGQVTGPFTFCTGVADQNRNAIFYDEQLKDAAVKLLALKARWQVEQLQRFGRPVIVFIDEPALAGFGTSEFISISKDAVKAVLNEVFEAVRGAGALAGVHVCANTDWSLLLESPADVVSFDAYSYFDRFILYPDQIKAYLDAGNILAWGIVPTGSVEDIQRETTDSLFADWQKKADALEDLGIDRSRLLDQSFITPSCGTGSLPIESARRVLQLTREVADRIRGEYNIG